MKTTMFALFLLLAFASSATADVVLDANGEPVSNNGGAYYILPDIFAKGDMNVDISFIAVPICAPAPSKWTIVVGEEGTKSVKITGYDNTLKGWFRIQNYDSLAYKIVFCLTDAGSCEDVGISSDDYGNRRLLISNGNPFAVVFVKSPSLEA
ncbi:kunitz-type trypsin inhibitor KTI2-like [Neltuma alba]|uniref:kunitz-type trypsin inhibitor KTI2-like n=1 Tax=Neltuma alba TaxID=207710 RepID=UPI0010A571F6|nr:kunitz-type trypsin inhibitor KTI2-like [Prosopis alba]